MSHEVATLLAKDHRVLIISERFNGIDFAHDLIVGSLLGETFLQFFFGLTLQLHSLGNLWGNFLFGVGNSSDVVSIGISDDLGGFGLSLLDDLSLDKLSLSCNLVVLQVRLSVDLLDFS